MQSKANLRGQAQVRAWPYSSTPCRDERVCHHPPTTGDEPGTQAPRSFLPHFRFPVPPPPYPDFQLLNRSASPILEYGISRENGSFH